MIKRQEREKIKKKTFENLKKQEEEKEMNWMSK